MGKYNYPKECFSYSIIATQAAKREYEIKYDIFMAACEEECPDYYSLGPLERDEVRNIVEKKLGYKI